MGEALYGARRPVLVVQALVALADLRRVWRGDERDPFPAVGADVCALEAALSADVDALRCAVSDHKRTIARKASAHARGDRAAERARSWVRRLRAHIRAVEARLDTGLDLPLPHNTLRTPAMLAALRALVPRLEESRCVLVRAPEDAAFVDEGALWLAEIEAADRDVRALTEQAERLTRATARHHDTVVTRLRALDRIARKIDADAPEDVPGGSREVLREEARLRVRQRRSARPDEAVGDA